jgi:hypothetical protein
MDLIDAFLSGQELHHVELALNMARSETGHLPINSLRLKTLSNALKARNPEKHHDQEEAGELFYATTNLIKKLREEEKPIG